MKTKKNAGKERILRVCVSTLLIVFAFYAVFTLVRQQTEISEKKEQLEAIKSEITLQEVKNEELRRVNDLDEEENDAYIEKVAREEFDYSKQGERVFINIAGD